MVLRKFIVTRDNMFLEITIAKYFDDCGELFNLWEQVNRSYFMFIVKPVSKLILC